MSWRLEPARVIAAVLAMLALAAAFGLAISEEQVAAIVGFVAAILALLGGEAVRANVMPMAKVEQLIEADAVPMVAEHDEDKHPQVH